MRALSWSIGRGYRVGGFNALCWSPDPPEPPPAPPAPPAGNTPPPQREPFATFHTKEQFEERRDREARAILKEKYGMSEAELEKRLARAKELEEAEQARIKAQQTTEERLKAEKEEAEAATAKAQAEAAEAKRQAEVTGLCARLGFKNLDYALFEAERSKKTGAELEAHFTEMAKDEGKKAALGLSVPAPEVKEVPVNTGPGGAPPPPAPPPPGGTPPGTKGVMDMSPAEFAAHVQRLG